MVIFKAKSDFNPLNSSLLGAQSTFLPRNRTVSSMFLQTEPVCCERKVTTFPWTRVSAVWCPAAQIRYQGP